MPIDYRTTTRMSSARGYSAGAHLAAEKVPPTTSRPESWEPLFGLDGSSLQCLELSFPHCPGPNG